MGKYMLFYSKTHARKLISTPTYQKEDGKLVKITFAQETTSPWDLLNDYRLKTFKDVKFLGFGNYHSGTLRSQVEFRRESHY